MINKKRLVYLSSVFGIFFIIIGLTGYFQVSVIKRNMWSLLEKEAELAYGHLKREIDINLEYLDLADRSVFDVTPGFLTAITYEDEVIEDLVERILVSPEKSLKEISPLGYAIFDKKGNLVDKRGLIQEDQKLLRSLLSGKERIITKPRSQGGENLTFGLRLNDGAVIVTFTKEQMKDLKRKYVLREIGEQEKERLKLVGINVYDPDGNPYYMSQNPNGNYFRFKKMMDSRYLPGYYLEVLLSRSLLDEVLQRTILYLLFTLLLLITFGALTGYTVFLVERKLEKRMVQFEREMAKNERLLSLGMLSSSMAHEIRNPLNAISLSLQRLKRDFVPADSRKEEYEQFLNVVGKEITRINRIVEDFLLLSRPEPQYEQINLNGMLDEIFTILKEKAESKGVRLLNLVNPEINVTGYKEKLKQALFNIVLNGIEAIDGEGQVKVEAEEFDEKVRISVEDNGSGIKEGEIERIFEYHYTTKQRGVGLGLPISYMIVKDHDGKIDVESKPGKGTIVRITIPKKREKK